MDRTQASSPLRLQQLVGAAERLSRKAPGEASRIDWLALVEQARDRLAQTPFVALPLDGFVLSEGGKDRLIASPRPADRLIEEALLPILNRALERVLLPSVHGYRPGRSTVTAAAEASRAIGAGHRHVALLDIADYFGSIDRGILRGKLAGQFAPPVVEVLDSLVSAPICLRGETIHRNAGIPLGRAVSPALANLYAMDVDAAMQTLEVAYLRYSDDIFVAARTSDDREQAEARLREALALLGLRLRDEKTRRICFDGAPLVYLGHTVDDHGVFERITGQRLERLTRAASSKSPGPPVPDEGPAQDAGPEDGECYPSLRQHTLYVTEPGLYLRTSQGLVVVQRGREVVQEIPFHRLDRVLILAGASVSSGFISGCVSHGLPVLFFVGKGKAYGSLVSGGMPNPLRLRAQYDLVADPGRRVALARAIVRAKLTAMLRRLVNADCADAVRQSIRHALDALEGAPDAESLRGYEGTATRSYYEGFATRIRQAGFELRGRSKRPPRDPVNSLLSFAYSLVFGEMQTLLLVHGLDPHPGVLHDLHRNHPALASDLIEPYRVLISDSFVLSLINNRQVTPDGFERYSTGGVYMKRETLRVVLDAYESFMDRPAGGGRGSGSPRLLIDAAARAMLRVVLGEADDLVLPLADRFIENQENETEQAP
jgi:CRISPR-associated protein Cas1